MKLKPGSYFLIAVLLVCLTVIIRSLAFEHLETKLLPIIVASLVFCLATLALLRELLAKEKRVIRGPVKNSADSEEIEATEEVSQKGQYFWIAGWIAGFALVSYLAGFLISIPLFILSYLKINGRGWLAATAITVIMLAFVYGIFELALKVQLYRGLLFSW